MRLLFSRVWWALTLQWLFFPSDSKEHAGALSRASLSVALISCALGVGSLIFVRSLVNGFEEQLSTGVAKFFGPLSYKTGWMAAAEHRRFVQNLPPTIRAESYWAGQALFVGPSGGRGVLLEGRKDWSHDEACTSTTAPEVSLAASLADYLGIKTGDSFRVLLPGILKTPVQAKLRSIESFSLNEIDARRALVYNDSLECYVQHHPDSALKRPGDFLGLRFYPSNASLDNLTAPKAQIEEEIRKFFRDSDPEVKTWKDQRRNFFRGLGFDRSVLSLVLACLSLAASLNLGAALFVIFFERDKEMMTLRALGLSPKQMTAWTFLQGFCLGVLGSALGVSGAWIIATLVEKYKLIRLPAQIYNLDHLVFHFEQSDVVAVFIFGVLVCLSMATTVGILLSRMKIVETLGHRR